MFIKGLVLIFLLLAGTAPHTNDAQDLRRFDDVLYLESTSETSANVSLGDLDGDGDLDIVLAKGRHWPLKNRVLINNGNGLIERAFDLGEADRTYSAVLADLDGDGDLDIAVSNDRPDKKLVYLNDGKAGFRVAGTWGSSEWITRNAASADLNGDRRPEVIAANRQSKSAYCINSGSAKFDPAKCSEIEIGSATSTVPADVDRDGDTDLVVPHRDGGKSAVFLNDGKGGFTGIVLLGDESSNARAAASGDLNGDGWPDIVVGDEKLGTFVYLNDGRGGFLKRKQLGDRSLIPYALAIADLNKDGNQDVVAGYVEAPGSVFFGNGNGTGFEEVRFGDAKGAVYGLAIGDLDGDGFPDIAAARSGASNVVYFSRK